MATARPGPAADPPPTGRDAARDRVYQERVRPFLKQHCLKCHDATTARAGFRIDDLGTDFLAGKTADHWKEVIDNINLGTMPPKKEPRPDPKAAFEVVEWVTGELRAAEKAAKNAGGRNRMRRLNRTEYANTVRDLFGLDENFARTVETELPMDGKVEGFDRGSASLFVDEGQLTRYLEVADLVLDRGPFAPKPVVANVRFHPATDARETAAFKDADGTFQNKDLSLAEITALRPRYFRIGLEDPEWDTSKKGRYVPHGPNTFEAKAGGVEYVSGGPYHRPPHYKSLHKKNDWMEKHVRADGWYRLRLRAGAFPGTGATALDEVKVLFEYAHGTPVATSHTFVIGAPLDAPKDYEALVYLRRGSAELKLSWELGWNGPPGEIVTRNPAWQKPTWQPVLAAGDLQRALAEKKPAAEVAALRKKVEEAHAKARRVIEEEFTGEMYVFDEKYKDRAALPRFRVESMGFEGPVVEWPPKGHKELFFAGADRADDAYLTEIFARFLPRAYRRPVAPAEVAEVVGWVAKERAARKLSFPAAVRAGVKAVLCSPGFLYLQEPAGPRRLTDQELAVRLAYFLWSTAPDAELTRAAAAGKLRDPAAVRAQVKRMLADPKAAEFARNFAGQWLRVRDFDGVTTDRDIYKQYDDDLKAASRREPIEFFAEVVRSDLPVLSFLDSNFAVVNERLAGHYGIAGVKGPEFRTVPLAPEHHRGGVLGMAGVLAYLSDGARTLPVRRGAYVLDTLWNAPPPPPPPNAGDLPVVKGQKLTVRQRLEHHRELPNCASCHAKIDPLGLALENYDAVGAWRTRQNGEGHFHGRPGDPPIDPAGALPGGRSFQDLTGFKAALLAEKDR
ncbi:DUF1592 domain-containing protein, partial [Gemmata sp.]|uniref:DUF1592 domain-containing protein n=1 Tax=Gemmata sp. TaxID=1914242 RepID=UPI003F70C707